ncbi:hypothetical protein ABK040_000366 [Willaertia magna]
MLNNILNGDILAEILSEENLLSLPNTLEELHLSDCKLHGNTLAHLTELTTLHLISCEADDTCIKNLPKCLTDLNISHHKNFTNNCLENRIYLKKLNISYCKQLTGDSLRNLTNLEDLNICDIDINDSQLSHLNKLKTLSISSYKITGECFSSLPNLEKLTVFSSLYKIKDENFVHLKKLKHMVSGNCKEYLEAPRTPIMDVHLMNFNNLKELIVDSCKNLTGECFYYLTNLEYLSINETNIKDDYFENLTQLKKLSMNNCMNITGKSFNNLTKLEELYATGSLLNDNNLQNCTNLQKLNLSNCYNVFGNGLTKMTKLEKLIINECQNFNGENLKYLSNSLDYLEADQVKLKDEHFMNLSKLRVLKIAYNNNITGEGLVNLTNLKNLGIYKCVNVSGKYLTNLSKLEFLSFRETKVRNEDLVNLKRLKL